MAGFRMIAVAGTRLGVALLLLSVAYNLFAAPSTAEYKLKAALIYKLTKFIEWPESAKQSAPGRFGICVLGDDDFGEALDALEARKARELPIVIQRHTQSESIDEDCQIVFISDSKRAFLRPILQSLKARPILTLSDLDGFAQMGGILQFTRGKRRIGFLINLESAKKSQLTIAAPLLDLATVVDSSD
jgi:hypothetical protein